MIHLYILGMKETEEKQEEKKKQASRNKRKTKETKEKSRAENRFCHGDERRNPTWHITHIVP